MTKLSRSANAKFVNNIIGSFSTTELQRISNAITIELGRRDKTYGAKEIIRCTADNLEWLKFAALENMSLHIIGRQGTDKAAMAYAYRAAGGTNAVATSWFCPCGASTSLDIKCGCTAYACSEYSYGWSAFDITLIQDATHVRGYYRLNKVLEDVTTRRESLPPKTTGKSKWDAGARRFYNGVVVERKFSASDRYRFSILVAAIARHKRISIDSECVKLARSVYFGNTHGAIRVL